MNKSPASANNGLVNINSIYSVSDTANRLEKIVTEKGMNVFARIDHAKGAKSIDKELRPTELIIFGNPMSGTPLMQSAQSVAIDLPMKALVWEDADRQVWLTYNDANYLTERHDVKDCDEVIAKIGNALANFAKAATT
jgi:uncharacterized protein (DUF302 family)